MARRNDDNSVAAMISFMIMLAAGAIVLIVAAVKFLWKHGSVWLRKPRQPSADPAPVAVSDPQPVSLALSVQVSPPEAERVFALGREATEFKQNKRWPEAVDCLVRQRAIAQDCSQGLDMPTLLRLPLFLQQAGRFEEALAEFERLAKDAEALVASWISPSSSEATRALMIAIDRQRVYDKARVACKREKRSDLEAHYRSLAEELAAAVDLLQEVVDRERARDSQEARDDLDVDTMRAGLQKVAYEMVGTRHDEETKARFKQGMTEFAALDPLVREIAEKARELVVQQPGILQSRIYAHFEGRSVEQVRYALYFAHELGWIHRRKKGSSYQLFPPGRLIDAEAN